MGSSVPSRTVQAVQAKYPAIAKDLLRPLLQLLIAARASCEGDMDKTIILLVLAIRAAEHPEFASLSYHRVQGADMETVPSLPINVRSLAESTGMARETVRRKVSELVQKRLVVRTGRNLSFSVTALEELGLVRELIVRQAVSNYAVIAPIILAGHESDHEVAAENLVSAAQVPIPKSLASRR